MSAAQSGPTNTPARAPLRHRYLHSPYGQPETLNGWDIRDPSATPEAECDYFREVFLELERFGSREGLTFVTTSSVDSVPVIGQDIVVVVLHDEWSRTPRFAPDVLAVLKCYGTTPWFPWSSLARPSSYVLAGLANYTRIRVNGVRHDSRLRGRPPSAGKPNVLPVPLGWFKQVPVPWVDYDARPYDASFVGSVAHDMERGGLVKRTTRRLVGNPKILSRRQLLLAVSDMRASHPEYALRVELSGNFHDVGEDQATAYSELMMSSKFAFAPRGTSLETFRFFEAIRCGTVPVCEPLPPYWFYDGAPVPKIQSWSQLPDLMQDLLSDTEHQHERHHRCLQWWQDRCSPTAVAERIEDWLRRVSRTGVPAAYPHRS